MSKLYSVTEENLVNIADAIRTKTNKTGGMTVEEMPNMIQSIAVGALDGMDSNLKYFVYYIEPGITDLIICEIMWDKIYEDTGSYDVTIPDKIGGYNVVIRTEDW